MNNYNLGNLLEKARREKARRDNAIKAAKEVSEYCKSVNECENGCVFYDPITGFCTFTKLNRYGYPKTPEDWEV